IGLFVSVMSLSGVAISLRLIENVYNVNHVFSSILMLLASFLFIVNGIFLHYRLFFYYEDVKVDFTSPIKMIFFGSMSISLLLLGMIYVDYNMTLSFIVWVLGASTQVGLTLIILSKLIWYSSFKLEDFNPAWFIPIVGNLIAPLGGVYHVDHEINWL